jgi:hypothetical protein
MTIPMIDDIIGKYDIETILREEIRQHVADKYSDLKRQTLGPPGQMGNGAL